MKKTLFFVAAAALALTACTSEDDILQTGQQKEVAPQEVGFDVYTPAAKATRAGLQGTMTTDRLKRSEDYGGGFGVYAYLVEDVNNSFGDANATTYVGKGLRSTPEAPSFMVNEKILWNSVNQGWYYNPIKYWPNETDNDSQSKNAEMEGPTDISTGYSHLDRLTFFAYAPYVNAGTTKGITDLTDKDGMFGGTGSVLEPSVKYQAALTDPNDAVDLLWGVAPSGGMNYTAVNGRTVSVNEGEPLMDMTKPDVNTNIKFLFQHALARINVKAVAAIDQVSPGGKLDPNTTITIKTVKLKGYFGDTGTLNLDNEIANVANWRTINGVDIATSTDVSDLGLKTIEITGDKIAEHVRYIAGSPDPVAQTDRIGVTTVLQDVIEPALGTTATKHCVSSIDATTNVLPYSESIPYYTDWDKDNGISNKATTDALPNGTYFTYGEDGSWTRVTNPGTTYTYPEVVAEYVATLEAGASSVFTKITDESLASQYAEYTAYKKDGTNKFVPVADIPEKDKDLFVLTATMAKAKPTYPANTYYKRDANYFMVVPTNNIQNISTTISANPEKVKALRTVQVEIEYYITTEDSKLAGQRAQTKNVVVKDVVFPSIANGKSYNLNLVLGLTSVKMEATVDDWKVINVQGDLPQNTDGN